MPMELRLRITDVKTGKVEYDQPSHSWTHVGGQILGTSIKGANLVAQIKDTGNTSRTYPYTSVIYSMAPSGNSNYGIVVGRDSTAESINDYTLVTPCTHGVGANQFNYGTTQYIEPWSGSTGSYLSIQRIITNNSGSAIDIKEVGFYSYNATWYFCHIRDVLASTVTCNNGDSKLIQYVISEMN